MPTTKPYEILMRRNGQAWAIHARSLITLDDGTVIEGKPVPLAGLTDPAFSQIATLVSASKDSEIATLTTERDSAQSELAELQTDYDAKVAKLQAAQQSIADLQAELEALRNPPNPFPNADWSGFRVAALSDSAVQRVAVGNPVLWPLLLMFLNELSSNPNRAADIAGLWNMMESVVPVTTEEIARVNTIAESKQVPFRLNADGQIGQV